MSKLDHTSFLTGVFVLRAESWAYSVDASVVLEQAEQVDVLRNVFTHACQLFEYGHFA